MDDNNQDLVNNTEPPTYSEDLLTDDDDLTGLVPALPVLPPGLHAGLLAGCQVTQD